MIDYWTFYGCSSLKSISVKNVTQIKPDAFNGCSSLSSITFSSGLTEIGDGAFAGTTSLKSVTFPSSLTYLGDTSFKGSGLTSVTIPSSVTQMPSNYGAFEDCKSLKTATINATVEEMPNNLFKNCTALTTVTFPSTSPVTAFSYDMFYGCTSLTSITLPPKLTYISRYCFSHCTSLTNITIPDTVEKIDYWAFQNCTKLTSIKIPYGVKYVGCYVFSECTSLSKVYFTKSIQEIESEAFYGLPTTQVTIYGYAGTAAKYFAQDKGFTYVECTPVTKITISGANSVLKNSSITLKANITPTEAFNKSVVWTSSNTNVATVNQSGVVTGKAKGTVTITAMAKDGTNIKGTYTVTVKLTELPFTDVTVDDWFYSSVKYCYQNGLVKGTSSTKFSPNDNLTRGMLATILWRKEGAPEPTGGTSFSDVSSSEYYYKAIKWASSKKIVSGYSGTTKFGPKDNVTREQLAVMLNNYCRYKNKYKASSTSLTTFTDGSKVSSYAKTAMQWAVGNKVITGNNNKLSPQGYATRAEVTSMLYKYCVNIK